MRRRNIVHEHQFTAELYALIPDPKEADEILQGAVEWFSHSADLGQHLGGTMWTKTISDFPHNRWLVIYYTMDLRSVHLQSVRHFDITEY